MVNSIRDKLDKADTISEINLLLNQDKNKVCVIVEGDDDQTLFAPLMENNTEVLQSYGSCLGVEDIITNHYKGNERVIGIRDKDYLTSPVNNQCFFCDYSCAEMMIVSVDSCFERLYCEFGKSNSMNSSDLRLHCLKHLEKLSKLRMLNYCNDWHVRFDGIKPSRCYQTNVDKMNKAVVDELNEMNPGNEINKEREAMCDALPALANLPELLSITNGHDFVNLFAKVAKGNRKNTSLESVEICLRASFGLEAFRETLLYKNLVTYQKARSLRIVSSL